MKATADAHIGAEANESVLLQRLGENVCHHLGCGAPVKDEWAFFPLFEEGLPLVASPTVASPYAFCPNPFRAALYSQSDWKTNPALKAPLWQESIPSKV